MRGSRSTAGSGSRGSIAWRPTSGSSRARRGSMAARNSASTKAADSDLIITRVFAAPRGLGFAAWTQPRHLRQWWAPKGGSTPFCTVDLRPGGAFHYCMRLADGRDIWGLAVYREIVAPERIVYT